MISPYFWISKKLAIVLSACSKLAHLDIKLTHHSTELAKKNFESALQQMSKIQHSISLCLLETESTQIVPWSTSISRELDRLRRFIEFYYFLCSSFSETKSTLLFIESANLQTGSAQVFLLYFEDLYPFYLLILSWLSFRLDRLRYEPSMP